MTTALNEVDLLTTALERLGGVASVDDIKQEVLSEQDSPIATNEDFRDAVIQAFKLGRLAFSDIATIRLTHLQTRETPVS